MSQRQRADRGCSWIQRSASSSVVRASAGTSNSSKCPSPSPPPCAVHAQAAGLAALLLTLGLLGQGMIVRSSCRRCGVVGVVGQEHGLARAARLVDVELAADDVGAQLGHAAERRRLSAGDRDEALEAVGLLVVEGLERPRQLASAVTLAARSDERAGRRPCGPLLRVPDGRESALRPRRTSAQRGPRARRGRLDRRRPTSWCRPPTGRAAAGRCRRRRTCASRLMTMLQRRPRRASRTPGEGRIGTSTPAIAATFSDHGPVALTTRSAWISPSRCRWSGRGPPRR